MTNVINLSGGKPVETEKYEKGDAIAQVAKDFVLSYDIPDTEIVIMGKDATGALRLIIPSDPGNTRTNAEQHYRLATFRYLLDQLMEQMIHNPVEG